MLINHYSMIDIIKSITHIILFLYLLFCLSMVLIYEELIKLLCVLLINKNLY